MSAHRTGFHLVDELTRSIVSTRPLDIDDPIPTPGSNATTNAGPEPSAEQIEQISMMGFTAAQSKKALRLTVSWKDIGSVLRMFWLTFAPHFRTTTPREPSIGCSVIPKTMAERTTWRWRPYPQTRTSGVQRHCPLDTGSRLSSRTRDRRYTPVTMSPRSSKMMAVGFCLTMRRWSKRRARQTRR